MFRFACYIYIQRNPRSYFVSKFLSIWRKLCYQFYLAWNKTGEIMEKVCEVGPKNLRKNFGLKNLPRQVMFLVISGCRKSVVMSTPKPDTFMQLFWTFVGVPVWPKCFFICARNLDEYFAKFIPSKFWNFFLASFFTVLLTKSSKWRKYL